VVVKRYRRTADVQKAILDAFERQHWPEEIADPLLTDSVGEGEAQLHDAVNKLNRGMTGGRLHFWSERGGRAVSYTVLPARHRTRRTIPSGNGSGT
jgi:hypothetical protein